MNRIKFFLVAVFSACSPVWAQTSGWQANQVNATKCTWGNVRVGVIRDTAYIDGGHLYWTPGMSDGTFATPEPDANPLGVVWRLNFSTPFSVSSNFSQILDSTLQKGANNIGGQPYYDGGVLADDYELYFYGGVQRSTSAFQPDDSQKVKKYEAYLDSSDRSFNAAFLDDALPSGITRFVTAGGAVSVPSEKKAFYFSGMRSPKSGLIFSTSANTTTNPTVVSQTLISVDMTVQRGEKWANQTLQSSVPGRSNPELVWVPVSQQGLLVAIGGSIIPEWAYDGRILNASQQALDRATNPGLMKTVSIYDVASGSWYSQDTTGDIPGQTAGLTQGCSTVASLQDGSSHHIYWYGGYDGIDEQATFSDDVYVLSLPSFVWTKVYSGTASHARAGHKCVKPYPDQMFVIGGYPSQPSDVYQCLGGSVIQIFNLSSASWMDTYDPTVWSNYTVPGAVVSNGGTGTGPSSWSSSNLQALFAAKYDTSKIKTWYPYSVRPAGGNPRTTASPTPGTTATALPSWVAPFLGVTLGLAFLTFIIVVFYLWRRRRFQRIHGSTTNTSDANRYRIMNWLGVGGASNEKTPTVTSDEVGCNSYEEMPTPEAGGHQIYEMPDSSPMQELDTGLRFVPIAMIPRKSLVEGSPASRISHVSRPSATSHVSQESQVSATSTGPVSPTLSFSAAAGGDARVVSDVSISSNQARDLAAVPHAAAEQGKGKGVLPEPIRRGTGESGISPMSPQGGVSPPTPPQGREGSSYITARPSPRSSPRLPGESRKSNFGEMLD